MVVLRLLPEGPPPPMDLSGDRQIIGLQFFQGQFEEMDHRKHGARGCLDRKPARTCYR